ncbi:MAG: RecQ family ATP-dependent DNA helicase [Bacteroidaceae bacterium]
MADLYRDILYQYWGYEAFRGIQREIIESIGSKHDTLGLMPTGGGKSITFQVPAMAMDGVCIVITPLIALMKDQVRSLKQRGIKAAAIYSGLSHQEVVVTLENCIFGGTKFLYVSPERLASELFIAKVKRINVSFITVDEAHCISQWGYDFRPAYLKVVEIRNLKPGVPLLALTATATLSVIDDIQEQLGFKEKRVFRMSFERKNLVYVVREVENKYDELLHILNSVSGSAIVYVRSRKGTKEVAEWLSEKKISALYYHAGLHNADKDLRQRMWQDDEVRVIVATNAFGMGIDKSDVRVVVHLDLPDSPEAYFQEAGRGGRDGQVAYAVLLYNRSDRTRLSRRVPDTFPDKSYICSVYEHLAYYFQLALGDGFNVSYDFRLNDFCRLYKFFPVPLLSALKILMRAGYIDFVEEEDHYSRLIFTVLRDELYQLKHSNFNCDQVIQTVLRSYSGLFSDYVFIDEADIAQRTGLSQQQVYETLKGLSQQRILHYVPRRKMACITYLTRRVKEENVVLSPQIYEERKEQYQQRIAAMQHYAESTDHCRSRLLLEYFGETDSSNCMKCDVCLEEHRSGLRQGGYTEVAQRVARLLSDGKEHTHEEMIKLYTEELNVSREDFNKAIAYLVHEEEIYLNNNLFSASRHLCC